MQFLLQEKSVQSEAAEGSAEKNHEDIDNEEQDVKPGADDDKSNDDDEDDEDDDDDDESEEFDSSDEQILTKSGESRKNFSFEV